MLTYIVCTVYVYRVRCIQHYYWSGVIAYIRNHLVEGVFGTSTNSYYNVNIRTYDGADIKHQDQEWSAERPRHDTLSATS